MLDEPTNDLDVETLDLLQDILGEYDGTVLLVSHDRDFIDRVATSTIAMEGRGKATFYPGGWSDYASQRGAFAVEMPTKAGSSHSSLRDDVKKASQGLSFTEKKRLSDLPVMIEKLESEMAKLTEYMAQPGVYETEPAKFKKASQGLQDRQDQLDKAEAEWLMLMEKDV